MPDRFASRQKVADKIEWEDGIFPALEQGLTAERMPEGDTELRNAWVHLEHAFAVARQCASVVQGLLPEPSDPDA